MMRPSNSELNRIGYVIYSYIVSNIIAIRSDGKLDLSWWGSKLPKLNQIINETMIVKDHQLVKSSILNLGELSNHHFGDFDSNLKLFRPDFFVAKAA